MPSYAHVRGEQTCPHCGGDFFFEGGTVLSFQWGYCPARYIVDGEIYEVGDALRWRTDKAGIIPPWTYFKGLDQAGNIGDPAVANLVARETAGSPILPA